MVMDSHGGAPGESGGGSQSRQEVIDNVTAAMARLRGAIERLREEVEANAQAEWVKAKPEIRHTIGELEGMVDALARRAKTTLTDIGSRLDDAPEAGEPRRDASR